MRLVLLRRRDSVSLLNRRLLHLPLAIMRLTSLVVAACMVAHWLACLIFFVATHQNPEDASWARSDGKMPHAYAGWYSMTYLIPLIGVRCREGRARRTITMEHCGMRTVSL